MTSPIELQKALGWWFDMHVDERQLVHHKSNYANSFTELNSNSEAIVDIYRKMTEPVKYSPLTFEITQKELQMIWRRALNTADPQKISAQAHGISDMLENGASSFLIEVKQ